MGEDAFVSIPTVNHNNNNNKKGYHSPYVGITHLRFVGCNLSHAKTAQHPFASTLKASAKLLLFL